ncbi:hypothetical protein [Corynebacterium sp. A21]|uniref:hypothetical protein n=1 Tax=Corynebacterium sp. A21 TaxID=3457318 RepID=UPI003FD1DE57
MKVDAPKNNSARWWIAGIVAVIVVIALVATALLRSGGQSDPEPITAPEPSTSAPESTEDEADTESSVSADAFGRRVVTPGNERGNPLTDQLHRTDDLCSDQEQARTLEGLEIQRTHNVMTVWSTSDGPSDNAEAIPEGYSRTPAGAALAAWNLSTLANAGGDVSTDVLADYMGMSDQDGDEFRRIVEEEGGSQAIEQRLGSEDLMVPDGHRILSCADDLVIVELAKPLGADASGPTDTYWQVLRIPMVWQDGHWEINGRDENSAARETINELGSEWSQWDF